MSADCDQFKVFSNEYLRETLSLNLDKFPFLSVKDVETMSFNDLCFMLKDEFTINDTDDTKTLVYSGDVIQGSDEDDNDEDDEDEEESDEDFQKLMLEIISKEEHTEPRHKGECQKLEDILDTVCSGDQQLLDDKLYLDFSNFRQLFVKNIVRDLGTACVSNYFTFYLDEKTGALKHFDTNKFIVCTEEEEKNSKYIIHEITIFWGDKVTGHANVVVVDKEIKEWELFEPHGDAPWTSVILQPLSKRMNYLYKDFIMVKPLDYCPPLGPQRKSGDEQCVNWRLLYIYLRLACPSLSRKEIMERLTDMNKRDLQNMLLKWGCFMWNYFIQREMVQPIRDYHDLRQKGFESGEETKQLTMDVVRAMNTTGDLKQIRIIIDSLKQKLQSVS